jgi:Uma2 family endonuclease
MNIHVSRPSPITTQAAEGLPRRRWSVAEVIQMVEAGIIDERERFELIGGEIVPMSPKGNSHEIVKKELVRFWAKALPPEIDMLPETTFYIGDHDFLEPDFIFWPRATPLKDIRPESILLLVEVSASSLGYDLGRKAQIYAALGMRELWVIDAARLVTHVHRQAGADGYQHISELPSTALLTPQLLPSLAVSLAGLGLQPMT